MLEHRRLQEPYWPQRRRVWRQARNAHNSLIQLGAATLQDWFHRLFSHPTSLWKFWTLSPLWLYTSSKNEKLVTRTIDSCSQDGPVAPDAPPCQRVQFDYTKKIDWTWLNKTKIIRSFPSLSLMNSCLAVRSWLQKSMPSISFQYSTGFVSDEAKDVKDHHAAAAECNPWWRSHGFTCWPVAKKRSDVFLGP